SSGTENTTGSILIRATKPARESRYAKIVDLVREAEESKAPMVRMADRYAVFFTLVTFGLSALAWLVFRDPVRVLAVLVVATPCPLILATPIAIISGMSRAAKSGVIVKQSGALEALSRVRTIFFDKTGTITLGVPMIEKIETQNYSPAEVLRLAAALDRGSSHILARAIVAEAARGRLDLPRVDGFREFFGEGVEGVIAGERCLLGKLDFLKLHGTGVGSELEEEHKKHQAEGKMSVYLARGGAVLGAVVFSDTVRKDAEGIFRRLSSEHNLDCSMITGDHMAVARRIADSVGIGTVYADCQPEDKVRIVGEAQAKHGPVAMVGDGVNDAPALARADVGIAMASHGDTATSGAADMVIIHSSIRRIADIYEIARRTIGIARQGIWIGIGLSIAAMIFAAFGYIAPLPGALLQEVIDVLVILSALRVLRIKV
ncbi:MAG TPA: heavy metal translocating P-type ATPase, partial [Candidatus Paceibacterota bacterium]|nr:heavy metal translocating P-type ATPase [Candidatus Paceibacterota bacterium]